MESVPCECLTDRQLISFQKAFNHYADSGTFSISKEDFPKALKMVGIRPSESEIREMIDEIGEENPIDLCEFIICIYYYLRGADTQEELIKAFKIFDTKNEGKLPSTTITQILLSLKHPVSKTLINELISQLNDGSNMIDYAKMICLMRPN